MVFRGLNAVELLDVRVKAGARELQLQLAEAVIGSDPACDLHLEDGAVSRRHCSVQLDEAGVRVKDLGSKNGTRLGDARIIEAVWEPGQTLTVGATKLTLELGKQPTEVPLAPTNHFGPVYGASVSMRALFAALERAAKADTTVLITGETGTGKDLVARALHEASSRREEPFVVCDCSALSAGVVEAELFGHTRGAFSGAGEAREGLFQAAHRGTLFLDEVGELPADLQPKLLRALESKKVRPLGSTSEVNVDVRVLAATHRDLHGAVKKKTFREDLFFRLAVIEVRVPALRERREDLPLLVEQLLAQRTPKLALTDLPANALKLLSAYAWPGNVRELRNVVERLVVTKRLEDLGQGPMALKGWHEARAEALSKFELDYVQRALLQANGNLAAAARALGVSRQLVHQLVTRHGLAHD
ncbi:MAG: sigma 54-dependent Fis family transcriptional regulator [Myxococcaceae bacterium]|nr:sigma 54-dependent Fis family transcriptional regulator [Myxococcaceae bacterium]